MYLMVFLELLIGDISTWPTYILSLLVEPPTTTTLNVSAFFYGNGVPLRISGHFFNLCNPYGGHDVLSDMHCIYTVWFQGKNALHHAAYYDINYKMYWIHGEYSVENELVLHEETDIPLGYEVTRRDEKIVKRLNEVSHEKCVLKLL